MALLSNVSVYLDTNFILYCMQNKIDYINELKRIIDRKFQILVPDGVIEELKTILKKGKTKEKVAAKIALKEVEKFNKGFTQGYVDNALLDLALKTKPAVVCTNDKELKKKYSSTKFQSYLSEQKDILK